eukprot:13181491-Ditylum_brightwellii.AAC.1
MAASNQTVGGPSSFNKAAIKRRETTTTAHNSNVSKSLGMGRSPTGLELDNAFKMEAHNAEEEEEDAFVEQRNTLNLSCGVTNALDPILERENDQSLENNASLDDVNSTGNAIYYRTASHHVRVPNNEQQQ